MLIVQFTSLWKTDSVRVALIVTACAIAAIASVTFAAAISGTYRIESPQGAITAIIEVHGNELTGSVDFMGKSSATLSGSLQNENIASGSVTSQQGTGAFAAKIRDDMLELTLFQGGAAKSPAPPPLLLRRMTPVITNAPAAEPAIEPGDKRLIGSWVYRDEYFGEEDSAPRNEYLEFRADGSYSLGRSGDAMEGSRTAFAARKMRKPETGSWRTEDSELYVKGKGSEDWIHVGRYSMKADGRSMRISYEQGNRKLWTRQ
jgi:hypothetical protein